MLKNKKGFTLVELLVAIAIMISITVVAIISITKISEQNKENAYKMVTKQIETAALEYFSANEYLFTLLPNTKHGIIDVGSLVKNGYLNTITNPITGKKLSTCAVVNVEKKDNKYVLSFDDSSKDSDDEDCNNDNSIILTEQEPETGNSLSIHNFCEFNNGNDEPDGIDHDSEWCYQSTFYIKTSSKINYDDEICYDIKDESKCDTGSKFDLIDDEGNFSYKIYTDVESGEDKKITVKLNNTTIIESDTYSIDRDKPVIDKFEIKSKEDNYNSNDVYLYVKSSDANSGLDIINTEYFDEKVTTKEIEKSYDIPSLADSLDGTSHIKEIMVKDLVGNRNVKKTTYSIYKECENIEILYENLYNCTECNCNNIKNCYSDYVIKDLATGKTCSEDTSYTGYPCNKPASCNAPSPSTPTCPNLNENSCPQLEYNSINGSDYRDGVEIKITPNSDVVKWDWYTNTGNGFKFYSTNYGTETKEITGEGSRYGKIVIFDNCGNTYTCYTKEIIIDRTAPACPSFTFSGTTGNNNWYTSIVDVKINVTNSSYRWDWYTKNGSNEWIKHSENNKGGTNKETRS